MEDGNQITSSLEDTATPNNITAEETIRNPFPYPCLHCHKSYTSYRSLSVRISLQHPQVIKELHHCHACPKAFAWPSSLHRHLLRHHSDEMPHTCPKCEYKCKTVEELKLHLKRHQDNRETFKCSICAKEYLTKKGLKYHLKADHDNLINEGFAESESDNSQKKSEPGFPEERKQAETNGRVVLEDGNQGNQLLEGNATSNNTTAGETIRNPAPHTCPHCRQPFLKKPNLNNHMRRFHPEVIEKPYQCHTCPKAYEWESSLKRHEQYIHSGKKSHDCPKCDYQCKTVRRLKRHLKTHEENRKRFKCSMCGKDFAWKCKLNFHWKQMHGRLKNESNTERDNSQQDLETSCHEEHNQGEASGGIGEIVQENFSAAVSEDAQNEIVTDDHHPSTEGSVRTENELLFLVWKCYCGIMFASEKDLKRHCNQDHNPDGSISEAATGIDSAEDVLLYLPSAQIAFLTATKPTPGPNNAPSL